MGAKPPCLWPWALRPSWLGRVDGPGWKPNWAQPIGTIVFSFYPFDLIQIISNRIQTSEICSNSKTFDKNMKSILLFEFKYNL
jgi:hypothetical protein